MPFLKRLNLCEWRGALIAVLLVRVVWGAWAAALTAVFSDVPPERILPLLPAQPTSGEWWHRVLVSPWMRFDYEYYESILTRGYSITDGTASFHPLYVMLAKPFFWATQNAQASLLLASTVSAFAGTLLMARYTRRFWGERVGIVAAWIFLLNPLGWILLAPYTEGTFLAFCIASMWAMREKRFWLAATLAGFATLARQQGALLLAPLAWELWRSQVLEAQVLAKSRARKWDWLCLLLVPLAYACYSIYRVRVVGEPLDTGRGWAAYLASWIVSPSTRIVVPDSGLAPPWKPLLEMIERLPVSSEPGQMILDALLGWALIAILALGWKKLHPSEKWLCAGVVAASVCFSAGAYMSFARHLMLAFPLSIVVALWTVEKGRARWTLEVMALANLLLCAAFIRPWWVP